jgi:hypothetical protein
MTEPMKKESPWSSRMAQDDQDGKKESYQSMRVECSFKFIKYLGEFYLPHFIETVNVQQLSGLPCSGCVDNSKFTPVGVYFVVTGTFRPMEWTKRSTSTFFPCWAEVIIFWANPASPKRSNKMLPCSIKSRNERTDFAKIFTSTGG